jgi:polyribonucleotide nucleotidyltransferase
VALQLGLSDLNLVYTCIKDKTLMISVEAREIPDKDLQAGLRFAHTDVTFIVITCLTLFIIEWY